MNIQEHNISFLETSVTYTHNCYMLQLPVISATLMGKDNNVPKAHLKKTHI
jgi:hypothetical protein